MRWGRRGARQKMRREENVQLKSFDGRHKREESRDEEVGE